MNLFDDVQETVFNQVANTFGYTATWLPSGEEEEEIQTARVLYKDATEKHDLSNVDYHIERYIMEYKKGDFNGLRKAVEQGDNETVQIVVENNTLSFLVRRIESKYDGKTITAILNPPVIV